VTGTFTLSLDTELIWGSFDTRSPEEFQRLYPDVRGTIDRLLALLDRYEAAATWAVLGHVFLRECARDSAGLAHAELVRPGQSWRSGDWYAVDPCTDRLRDPLWYGDDIVDAILAARTPQEIGSHSFGHVLYGDPALTSAAVDADLDACLAEAAKRGIVLRSFVFPRNSEGHHEALRVHGFRAFRGADPTWHSRLPGLLGRAGHLLDQAAGLAPPVSKPHELLPGLWNIPGSALVMDRTGARRAVSMAARVRKAQAGLRRAVETGGVFHLWTHPFNIASDPEFLLASLETVLREAAAARDRGELAIETMGATAERLSSGRPYEEATT
jgi:peptidoglycan/xylan/chitin deacetylase (PgdA/CDA1 family)